MNENDKYTIVSVSVDPPSVGFRHTKTGYVSVIPCTEPVAQDAIKLWKQHVRVSVAVTIQPWTETP